MAILWLFYDTGPLVSAIALLTLTMYNFIERQSVKAFGWGYASVVFLLHLILMGDIVFNPDAGTTRSTGSIGCFFVPFIMFPGGIVGGLKGTVVKRSCASVQLARILRTICILNNKKRDHSEIATLIS